MGIGGRLSSFVLTIVSLAIVAGIPAFAEPPRIEIVVAPDILKAPFTGKLYVMTTTQAGRDPIHGPGWFNPQPFFAFEVKELKNGQTLVLDPQASRGHPLDLGDLPSGRRGFQAVLPVNDWNRAVTTGPGNVYSQTVFVEHDPENPGTVKLELSKTVRTPKYSDSDQVKYVRLKSKLLSDFHKRDVYLQAALGLPEGYDEDPARRYPTMYEIPGFGGNLRAARWVLGRGAYSGIGLEIVHVFLDPECPLGHHVFADSANNGPWGAALTTELIPHLEKEFRLIPQTGARYVTGHSSGGWSSLWLQVAYPDVFGGVWSTAPDPVDFHAFQLVDIYADGANMYEADGKPIPVSRETPQGQIFTRQMSHMEDTLGRGGQLQSFEAVFSPRGPDGQPLKMWDRETGAVNPKVAKAWEKYDINLHLRRNWDTIGPKLAGKIHIVCGDADTFWLERAVFRLRDTLKELGSDAKVVMIEGADHRLPQQVMTENARQVAEKFAAFEAQP